MRRSSGRAVYVRVSQKYKIFEFQIGTIFLACDIMRKVQKCEKKFLKNIFCGRDGQNMLKFGTNIHLVPVLFARGPWNIF